LCYCFSYYPYYINSQTSSIFSHSDEFSSVLSAIRSIDARKADVTVETDRDNIFGAIEQLPDGFEGLNQKLRECLLNWFTDRAKDGLEKMNPNGPPINISQIKTDSELLEDWPFLVDVLNVYQQCPGIGIASALFSFLVAIVFFALCSPKISEISRDSHCYNPDLPPLPELFVDKHMMEMFVIFLAYCILGFVGACVNTKAGEYQLRRTQLFSCQTSCCLRCVSCSNHLFDFYANYFLFASTAVGLQYLGYVGLIPILILQVVLFSVILVFKMGGIDQDAYQLFKSETAYLLYEIDRGEEALCLFQELEEYFVSTEQWLQLDRTDILEAKIGMICCLHKLNRGAEATAVALDALETVDISLGCCYSCGYQQCCRAGLICRWEHDRPIVAADWYYMRAKILAANRQPDEVVLAALELAVSQGLELGEWGENVRFMDINLAFASLTDRVDAESKASGKSSLLATLEAQMEGNGKKYRQCKRWWVVMILLCVAIYMYLCCVYFIDDWYRPCDSNDGIAWLGGLRGCGGVYLGMECNMTRKMCDCSPFNASNVSNVL
jgi:hypothetical protein